MSASVQSKPLQMLSRAIKLITFSALLLAASTLLVQSRTATTLEHVLERGEIVMLSRNGPTTYYEGVDGYTGFEYELGRAFADYLGVDLVVEEEADLSVMLTGLNDDLGDFAAATLTVTEQRQYLVDFGPEYGQVSQVVIYRAGTRKPRSVEDLIGGQI